MESEEIPFVTLSPAPSTPSNLLVSDNASTGMLEVRFSPVVCASDYRIHLSQDSGELEVVNKQDTETSLSAPEPCHTFR
jgi:hypothetical protein